MVKKIRVFSQIKGLKPVPKGALAEYEREMSEETIPEIIKAVGKRRALAIEARRRQLIETERY